MKTTHPPYYILPDIRCLKENGEQEQEQVHAMARRIAIAMPDRRTVDDLLADRAPLFDNFYAEEVTATPSTEDTIDTFLNTFGKPDPREADALERMIFNPTPDYASVLAAEEKQAGHSAAPQAPRSEQDKLIDSFIAKTSYSAPTESPVSKEPTPAVANESVQPAEKSKLQVTNTERAETRQEGENTSLTESFARVMIKNGNYSRALKIISELSLKNPEKSVYFADQIRFLKKLIINENNK